MASAKNDKNIIKTYKERRTNNRQDVNNMFESAKSRARVRNSPNG